MPLRKKPPKTGRKGGTLPMPVGRVPAGWAEPVRKPRKRVKPGGPAKRKARPTRKRVR